MVEERKEGGREERKKGQRERSREVGDGEVGR